MVKTYRDISFVNTDPTAEPREFLSAEQHQCPCGKPMVPSLVTPFEGLFAMPDSRRNILTESQPTHFKGGGRATLTRSSRGQSNCQECIQRADFERGKYRMTDMVRSFYFTFVCTEQEYIGG